MTGIFYRKKGNHAGQNFSIQAGSPKVPFEVQIAYSQSPPQSPLIGQFGNFKIKILDYLFLFKKNNNVRRDKIKCHIADNHLSKYGTLLQGSDQI
jgi:hypothetical protein